MNTSLLIWFVFVRLYYCFSLQAIKVTIITEDLTVVEVIKVEVVDVEEEVAEEDVEDITKIKVILHRRLQLTWILQAIVFVVSASRVVVLEGTVGKYQYYISVLY